MSGSPRVARALRLRVVGATALALATVVLCVRAVYGWLDLDAAQLRQQTAAWSAYSAAFWVLFLLYAWRALRPVARFLAPAAAASPERDAEIRAAARAAALHFPSRALALGIGLAFCLLGSKLALDLTRFELRPSTAAILALCGAPAILGAGALIYALLHRWLRPVVACLSAEDVPAGMRFGLRARVGLALAIALATAVPALAIGSAQLRQLERGAAARCRPERSAPPACAGSAVTRAAAASAAQGVDPLLYATLAALLCFGVVIGWDLGGSLRGDVRRVAGQINALATSAAEVGSGPGPVPPGASQVRELRDLADGVNALLARMTDVQLASFLAVEQTLEADRARTQFLANMTHDLRSPLNAILGYCELLQRDGQSPLTAAQRGVVEAIQRNGAALLRAITQVLDLARVRSRRLTLHLEDVPPAELLTAALRLLGERGAPDGVALESVLQPGLPALRIDPQRVAEAIAYLAGYCAAATGKGHVAIRLAGAPPAGDDPRHQLIVEVEDDDATPLLDAELVLAADPEPRPGHPGLGLELPLARAFIELHEGTLQLTRGETLGGHRFVARIPALARTSATLRPLKV